MSGRGQSKWYRDGLKFECTQCGNCCSGEPGYVWVSPEEIVDMARVLELDLAEFRSKYIRRVSGRLSLVEYANGDCVFLDPDSRRCAVYSARPVQCRTWPFWDSNLDSQRAWRETCRICPGAGQGKLYPLETIEIKRKQRRV